MRTCAQNSSGFPARRAGPGALALAGALLITASACAQFQERPGRRPPPPREPAPDLAREGRELFQPRDGRPGEHAPVGWSIVLVAYRGEGQDDLATLALERVRMVGGFAKAYVDRRGQVSVVAYGDYTDPSARQARADLERVRGFEHEGSRPFAAAYMAPPAEVRGTIPELDLKNAKSIHGKEALYTLQVGVYSKEQGPATGEELAEFRAMAERAVVQLRREGEQAFYFHGPSRSMVTIGAFGVEDFDPQVPGMESAALRELRKRHPHNLQNGRGVRERVKGLPKAHPNAYRIQASALVGIPEPG